MGRGRAKAPEDKNQFAVQLGRRIRVRRDELSLTQRELSKRAKYDAVQLSRVESGDAVPRADAMLRLAVALQTSVGNLYGLPEDVTQQSRDVAGTAERLPEGPISRAIAALQDQIDILTVELRRVRDRAEGAGEPKPRSRRSA